MFSEAACAGTAGMQLAVVWVPSRLSLLHRSGFAVSPLDHTAGNLELPPGSLAGQTGGSKQAVSLAGLDAARELVHGAVGCWLLCTDEKDSSCLWFPGTSWDTASSPRQSLFTLAK